MKRNKSLLQTLDSAAKTMKPDSVRDCLMLCHGILMSDLQV